MSTKLTLTVVRRAGLAAGLADYKICSIDDTLSALLFTRRSKDQTETLTGLNSRSGENFS